eukprot:617362-Ditylum_brightwellii.AAC.1
MERSKQNVHVVGDEDTVVDVSVDDSDDSADKHLTHPSQMVDCHSMESSKQNVHVVGDKDNGVDDGVDDSVDSANKQFTHFKIG